MKLVLRTVTGATTNHDVEGTATVLDVKNKLADEYDVPSLRLCHKGKVLEDNKTIDELGFKDGEVLIVAGKKKTATAKAPPPPPAETSAPAPAATTAAPAPTATAVAPSSTPATTGAPTAPPAPAPTAPPAPAPALAPVDQGTVEMIMSMGFDDKAKVEHALRCAYGNGDRAVDYLVSGIPPGVEAQFRQQQAAPAPRPGPTPTAHRAPAPTSGAPPPSGGDMTPEQLGAMMAQMQQQQHPQGSALERALRGIPQFPAIAATVRQNPGALPEVMRQLQANFPDIFALVQANPQEFLDIINDPAKSGGPSEATRGGGPPAGARRMELTEADVPAIERLVQLGGGAWDQRAAAIMYLATNRNEELAANVLFDNGGLPAELAAAVMSGEPGGDEGSEGSDDGAPDS